MSLPKTILSKALLEVVGSRPLLRDANAVARTRSQSKPSCPSRIAMVGNEWLDANGSCERRQRSQDVRSCCRPFSSLYLAAGTVTSAVSSP